MDILKKLSVYRLCYQRFCYIDFYHIVIFVKQAAILKFYRSILILRW